MFPFPIVCSIKFYLTACYASVLLFVLYYFGILRMCTRLAFFNFNANTIILQNLIKSSPYSYIHRQIHLCNTCIFLVVSFFYFEDELFGFFFLYSTRPGRFFLCTLVNINLVSGCYWSLIYMYMYMCIFVI